MTWASSQLIDRARLVGSPNAGAVKAVVQLGEGTDVDVTDVTDIDVTDAPGTIAIISNMAIAP